MIPDKVELLFSLRPMRVRRLADALRGLRQRVMGRGPRPEGPAADAELAERWEIGHGLYRVDVATAWTHAPDNEAARRCLEVTASPRPTDTLLAEMLRAYLSCGVVLAVGQSGA